MKKPNKWEETKASGDYDRPSAGGYICTIMTAEDIAEKEYIKIEYDFIEGDYKGYWTDAYNHFGWWGGNFIRSYKEKALGMFKAFTNAVEASNTGYTWNFAEKTLEGKIVGLVLGEEEYIGNDGSVKTRLYVKTVKNVDDIRNGKFKVPELKKLEEPTPSTGFTTVTDEDTPF